MNIPSYTDSIVESCRAQIRCIKQKVQNETVYAYALVFGSDMDDVIGYFNTMERYEADKDSILKRGGVSYERYYVTGELWCQDFMESFAPFYKWVVIEEAIRAGTATLTAEEQNLFYSEFEPEDAYEKMLTSVIKAAKDEINTEPRACFADDVYISLQTNGMAGDRLMHVSCQMSKLMNSSQSHELHKRYWRGANVDSPKFLSDNPELA